jgi:hypothetical protein
VKTPREWDLWCDAVWQQRGQYPTWHELITAVQQDASGAATLTVALLAGPTEPDYGAQPGVEIG